MVPRRKVPIGEKSWRHFFPQPFKKPAKIRSRSEKSRLSQKMWVDTFRFVFVANKPKFSAGKLRQRKFRPQFSPVPKISKNDKLLQELYSGKIEHNFLLHRCQKHVIIFLPEMAWELSRVGGCEARTRPLCNVTPGTHNLKLKMCPGSAGLLVKHLDS